MSIFDPDPNSAERTVQEKQALFRQQTQVYAAQTRDELTRRYKESVDRLFGEHPEGLTIHERAEALGDLLPEALITSQLIRNAVNAASPEYIPDDYIAVKYGLEYDYSPETGLTIHPVDPQ